MMLRAFGRDINPPKKGVIQTFTLGGSSAVGVAGTAGAGATQGFQDAGAPLEEPAERMEGHP